MSTVADDWFPKHRINVEEYYRMAEVGLLARDARVELIQGEVIDMAPIGSKHAALVDALGMLLTRAVGDRAIVGMQRPIRLSAHSEPQPDVTLLKPRADFYSSAHPTASDVLLLIEVSDTTLRYDREIKVPLYASHGIPEVWLIDLNNKQMLHMREPNEQAYASLTALYGGNIESATMPGVRLDLSGLLNL